MILRPGEEPVAGYRLQRRLGRGAIGEVWQATGPGGTSVALKFVNLAGKPAIKELKALQHVKQVRHAHLTPIHAFWMLDGGGDVLTNEAIEAYYATTSRGGRTPHGAARPATLVIAMQIGDKSLADRLEECRATGLPGIEIEELLGYMEDSAKGLDFLNSPRHDLGQGPVAIQHCDVKPQNILLMGDSASVCDFGLARVLGESHTTSAMAGSPAYMAPECIEGPKPSNATDQYALAISYAELRTGQLPFHELNYGEVLHAHLTSNLKLDRLEPLEQAVVRRATSRDPASRFPSSVAMVRALRRAIEGVATGSISGTGLTGTGDSITRSGDSFATPPAVPSTPLPESVVSSGVMATIVGTIPIVPVAPEVAHSPPPQTSPPPSPPPPPGPVPPGPMPRAPAGGNVNEQKLYIAQLAREGHFAPAMEVIETIASSLTVEDVAQLRGAVAARWFTRTVQPLVDRAEFVAALQAIDAAPATMTATRKSEWLAEIKSRWTRFAADQLKRGRTKPS